MHTTIEIINGNFALTCSAFLGSVVPYDIDRGTRDIMKELIVPLYMLCSAGAE